MDGGQSAVGTEIVSSPDPTHPDHHAALDVLLALRLLAVGETQVLPVARGQQARPRLHLGQQPGLDLVVGVDADPGGQGRRLKNALRATTI